MILELGIAVGAFAAGFVVEKELRLRRKELTCKEQLARNLRIQVQALSKAAACSTLEGQAKHAAYCVSEMRRLLVEVETIEKELALQSVVPKPNCGGPSD